MKPLITVSILMSVLLLAGCETPYQRKEGNWSMGGYEDAHIRDNVYYVNITTNGWTSPVKAAEYFHRRAKELCAEHGYRDYRTRDERDTSTHTVVVSGSSTGASGGTMLHPGFAGYVICIK